MILDLVEELNWLAVLVATVAWFAFSAIWYTIPPISKAWQRAARVDVPENSGPMATILISNVILYFVIASVIAMLAESLATTDLIDGIELGVALGLAFGVAQSTVTQIYEQKGGSYWLINGLNAVIGFSIVGAIVTVMN